MAYDHAFHVSLPNPLSNFFNDPAVTNERRLDRLLGQHLLRRQPQKVHCPASSKRAIP